MWGGVNGWSELSPLGFYAIGDPYHPSRPGRPTPTPGA